MAHSLGHDNDVETLMTRIAKRIHSNQQPEYLGFLRVVWQRYLLPGWLRKQLDLSPEKLSSYADFVLATAKRRLEDGPLRPEALYADKSIHGLLEILEHNTKTDPRYEDEDEDQNSVPPEQRQVLRPAATDEEISAAEERIGRLLPDDMKDFLRISNGCGRIRSGAWLFRVPLPPLDQIYLEDEGYMADYTFTLLPDADLGGVEVDWPGITGGGIAMYENDGQGTDYVWILTEELVAEAKARLDEAYVAATGEQKGKITRAIEQLYGSVRAFDEMRTCVYRQGWGSPSGQICCPSFRAFLCRVVYESQYVEERSPLGIRQEDLF